MQEAPIGIGVSNKADGLFIGLGTHENQRTYRSVVFHQILDTHDTKHDYYAGGNGAHDWATWQHLLYASLLPGLWHGKR